MIEYTKNYRKRIILLINILLLFLFFISFVQLDILITTRHGITFWNALFAGKLRDFYVMNETALISQSYAVAHPAVYDIPIYLLFAVWDFPLWLFEKMTGMGALDTVIGILWAKSIILPFLAADFWVIYKIVYKINPEEHFSVDMLLMCTSSSLLYVPCFVMNQYDAIGILFLLLGVYYYISDDKKKYLFWFSVAVTFKMFALFVFIPLVLAKEKKIISIFINLVSGIAFLFLCKNVQKFFFVVSDAGVSYLKNHLLPFIFQGQISFVYGASSIFIICFVLLCLYAYFIVRPEQIGEMKQWVVYIGFLGFLVFFVTSMTHPQWSILLLPFSSLLVFGCGKSDQKVGLLLDTVFSAGLLLAEIIQFGEVFSIRTGVYLLPGKLFYDGKTNLDYSVRDLLAKHITGIDIGYINLIGGGIFVAGIIFFAYWAKPKMKEREYAKIEISFENIILIRMIIMLMLGALLFLLFRS